MKRLLITGGAGFIGSNFVKRILRNHTDWKVIVLDALTYAGNLDNFTHEEWDNPNFKFQRGDVRNEDDVKICYEQADAVVHMAAETHVDRSIDNSDPFASTDFKGTQVLLETLRKYSHIERFIHISTSEVYGTAQTSPMDETHPLNPGSPYAACKAGADRLAFSFYKTYDLPVTIIRPFNNYGSNQYPEKMIPLFITQASENKPLPVYGDGKFTRDWLYVEDCCKAVEMALASDISLLKGESVNLGTGVDVSVIDIAKKILDMLGKPHSLIENVTDRPGHVEKLISSTDKAKVLLGWEAETKFEEGIEKTVNWYLENQKWWKKLRDKIAIFDFNKVGVTK